MTSQEFNEKLNTAFNYHQQGKLFEAEVIYNELIKEDPDNANVLNLLGLILHNHKQYDKAAECLEKAAIIAPSAYLYFNLGNIYYDKEEVDNAINKYKKGLELEKNNFKLIYSLGQSYKKQNDWNSAITYYEKALLFSPNDPEIYRNLGISYLRIKKTDEAIQNFNKAIEIRPDYSNAHLALGDAYKEKQANDIAINCYKQAIHFDKMNQGAYLALGTLFLEFKKADEASEIFETIIKLKPDEAELLLDLGLYYEKENMPDKAFETYNKILQLKPDSFKAYLNLSTVYFDKYDYDKSIECCHKALNLKHNYADAYLNLGNAYKGKKENQKAIEYFQKALNINPDYVDAHFNMGTTYLLTENFDLGWSNYEWRFFKKEINHISLPKFTQPTWDGSSLEGKTIYVCFEQGFGDTLQFSRYLPLLASMGAKVIFKCQIELERLLKQSNLNAEIINNHYPDNLLEFDTYTHLLSLPLLLGTNTSNIPCSESYLKADKALVEQYKEKYFDNDCFKIGICWNCSEKGFKKRGILLEYFYKFATINNVKLYSLQKGIGVEQLESLPPGIEIVDLGKTFNNFADTAAAVENLDLVISTDTSMVHLAGAIGKPIWNLVTFASCWRWLEDRCDTPWYKSMKLFRQETPGNWEELVEKVYLTLVKQFEGKTYTL